MGNKRQRHCLRSRRARARIALALCVLWVAGFEVLPWLHIATHAHVGKHHHDESGAIIRDDESAAREHEHEHVYHHDETLEDLDSEIDEHAEHVMVGHRDEDHDDHDADVDEHADRDHDLDEEVDEHGAPVRHHTHRESQKSRDKLLREAIEHGRHSLAHHDIASLQPPPALTEPYPIDRPPSFVFEDTAIEPYSFSPGRAVARGPPDDVLKS